MTQSDSLYPIATLPRRLGALLYDLMAVISLFLVVGAIWVIGFNGGLAIEPGHALYAPMMSSCFIVAVGFFLFFWLRDGQTLGMRAWRLSVQSRNGQKITLIQALVRALSAIVSFMFLGLGYFWALITPTQMTWHDMISHSVIVQLPKKRQ